MKTLQELIDVLNQAGQPQQHLIYRLYHDQNGCPLFYSMEDLPGDYIDITVDQFNRSNSHVRVVDGRLIEKSFDNLKLVPSTSRGQYCCSTDVSIVVDSSQSHRRWEFK